MNNIGKIDRLIRMILAVTIVILHATHVIPRENGEIILIGAALLAMTALRKCCPIYGLLGFGTCNMKNTTKKSNKRIKTRKLDI